MSSIFLSDKQSFVVAVDSSIYSVEVCQKACYALLSYMSCQVATSDGAFAITVLPAKDCDKDAGELRALLLDELLDYSLREKIAISTEPLRNLILSNAFSNTKLVG
jgi:His-Xaa-Ser system protein HxsD